MAKSKRGVEPSWDEPRTEEPEVEAFMALPAVNHIFMNDLAKDAIVAFLKENLSIELDGYMDYDYYSSNFRVEATLRFAGEVITTSSTSVPLEK